MSTEAQFPTIRRIIRYAARGMRQEFDAVTGLLDACQAARAEGVGELYLMLGVAMLRQMVERYGFGASAIPPEMAEILSRCRELAVRQAPIFEDLATLVEKRTGAGTERALMLGDGAVLASLYGDLGAFAGSLWLAGAPAGSERPRPPSVGIASQQGSSYFEVVSLGPLEPIVERWSLNGYVGARRWRLPRAELLTVLLSARVGDALAHPDPPVWPHLALALKGWQERISSTQVLALARELDLEEAVHRGLATVSHLFPELERWVPARRLKVSRLERALAIPLAAKKLLSGTATPGAAGNHGAEEPGEAP